MTFANTLTIAIAIGLFATQGLSQTEARSPALFDSRNAIIDTAIPFAIGAQEAQQSLRGSFGWQTFQEGLVEGVYYRFDPDGYARFAPTPRLDQDQFEVVCVPRSFVCTGQKGGFHLALNQRGALQIQLENLGAGDQFFLFDGTNELPLPARILEPLDIRLESLLMSGGELVVKRNGQAINNISLTGFSAVTAYIRWVAAGQDYSVLPRNWPIPNSATSATSRSITQPDTWTRPVLSGQSVIPYPNTTVRLEARSAQQQEIYDPTRPLTRILAPEAAPIPDVSTEISALQSEIQLLTQKLTSGRQISETPLPRPLSTAGLSSMENTNNLILEQVLLRLSNIENTLARLENLTHKNATLSLSVLQDSMQSGVGYQTPKGAPTEFTDSSMLSTHADGTMTVSPTHINSTEISTATRRQSILETLPITESDIVGAIEILLSQQSKQPAEAAIDISNANRDVLAAPDSSVVLDRAIVERILAELDQVSVSVADPILRPQQLNTEVDAIAPANGDQGYKSLSEYFQATAAPNE